MSTFSQRLLFLLLLFCPLAKAQELAPRAYWPAPVGTNVVLLGYQRSEGDVLVDPTIPVDNAEASFDYAMLTYQRSFGLFGRTTSLQFNLPYTSGEASAIVDGDYVSRSVKAVADARARFAINLLGAPAMNRQQFRQLADNPVPQLGVSVLASMPTGGYSESRLLNVGSNRWAVKPALGGIYPLAPGWFLEGEIGMWFYQDNDDYLGQTRSQDDMFSTELHLVAQSQRGAWFSLDVNWYEGGEATVGTGTPNQGLANSRIGFTYTNPFNNGRNALRLSYSTPLEVKGGGDFDTITLALLFIY